MQWLNNIVEVILAHHPDGDILIESGASPSGPYHLGALREIVTADAILLELKRKGHSARHVQFVDDMDALRKVPTSVPADYNKHLGKPLCDIPAPDSSGGSYADYFLKDFLASAEKLGIEMDSIRSHERYRAGFFGPAIEKTLDKVDEVRHILRDISGRELEDNWSPIQVMEDEYLKMRPFISLDKQNKTVICHDKDGNPQTISYADGKVKLNWRIDWPARWWLLKVSVEPSGRDHQTKGGAYDTGAALVKGIFGDEPPIAVAYDFINRAGDTKKMSASAGTGIDAAEVVEVLPPEVVRFFILRYAPSKRLYFDPAHGAMRLIDEYSELVAKPNKTEAEEQLLYICTRGLPNSTVSSLPFSHLVESYQASLRNPQKTLEVLGRTEHASVVRNEEEMIKRELNFIEKWLQKWAPEDIKFSLVGEVRDVLSKFEFTEAEKDYLKALGDKIAQAPADAEGDWFHKAIYELDGKFNLTKQQLFSTLYKALIGKISGPRAGWFLSILPRDWLIKRFNLEA